MRMRVYAAWHYVLAAGVDNRCAFWGIQPFANCHNQPVLAKYISAERSIRVDDGAALNKYSHDELRISLLATT